MKGILYDDPCIAMEFLGFRLAKFKHRYSAKNPIGLNTGCSTADSTMAYLHCQCRLKSWEVLWLYSCHSVEPEIPFDFRSS